MISLLGSHTRRYVVVIVFVFVCLALWKGFDPTPSDSYSSTTTSSTAPKVIDSFKYIPSTFDWSKAPAKYPATDIKWPPSNWPKTFPRVQARTTSAIVKDDITAKRKQTIKSKFVKSWEAYKAHAWTKDELMPLSGKGKQTLSGWSAQLVDAMDTLWIMDLKDEFRRAVKEAAVIDWNSTSDQRLNLFEIVIRYLGGLISAYDLSGEQALLDKAIELADLIYAGFDTPNRFPPRWLELEKVRRGDNVADSSMSGAAGGSMCLEFTRLSQITGDPKYYDATERLKQFFLRVQNDTAIPGLWPHDLNYRDETFSSTTFNLGAGMDSLYEYLPKMHALLGGQDAEYVAMTVAGLDALRDNILFRPMTPNDANILLAGTVVVESSGRQYTSEMEHLTCFAGGMYGLAGKLLGRADYVDLGTRLAAGCVWAYDAFSTNLMPESSRLVACPNLDGPCPYDSDALPKGRERTLPEGFVNVAHTQYLLRPEAIESVFYLWRITGDHAWREAAWRMWEGIVRETETEMAFASISDVTKHSSGKVDSMETFWMGETLKYFYLIFDDESTISLDEWVLNTEAHPFKRPQ